MQNLKKYLGINLLSLFSIIIFGLSVEAQSDDIYFQQEVNYNINISLDDINHSLKGDISIVYHNNSPDTLNFIWFHLWPNAYKNQSTAFAKQMLEYGNSDFYFSKESQRGYIDSLYFTINDLDSKLEFDKENIDIAKLYLNKALSPGDSIKIHTPFYVKIPEIFSRLGHYKQAYYISQWYPKPAVYDKEGWHQMPYLNMGEFYSEFGNYDVYINLPKNYRVAASGQLQTYSEREWLSKLNDLKPNEEWPISNRRHKLIHYHAEKVHDFAWFADKRFCVRHERYGKSQEIMTFFLPESIKKWKDANKYVKQAIDYYSSEIGKIHYPTISAVEGDLGVGGGMEYPGVTLISTELRGLTLEQTIMHEVGHNWFYGMLGFNERTYPWLDEGLNSFYEKQYMEHYHPDIIAQNTLINIGKDSYSTGPLRMYSELMYKFTHSIGIDQAANIPSANYNPINYGTVIYNKTVSSLYHLQEEIGEEEFRKIMQGFFIAWQDKHPGPYDLKAYFEKESNKDLSWFFDGLIGSTEEVDYIIKKRNNSSIKIKNKGKIPAPILIKHRDNILKIEGFTGEKQIALSSTKDDTIQIDPNFKMLEMNRSNNTYHKGFFHHSNPLKLKFFGGIDDFNKNELYYIPIPLANGVDGFSPGILLYNNFIPVKNFEYQIMPLYGTKSKKLTGLANITYRKYYISNWLKGIRFQVSGKQFSEAEFSNDFIQYQKAKAKFTMEFKLKNFSQNLEMDFTQITTSTTNNSPKHYQQAGIHFKESHSLNPYNAEIILEHGSSYIKIWLNANYKINYNKKKGLDIRFFAGVLNYIDFANHPNNVNFRLSGSNSSNDYLYDLTLLNRSINMNDYELFSAHQFVPNQGGFVLYTPLSQSDALVSLSLQSSTPLPLIKIYSNFAVFPDLYKNSFYDKANLLFESGIELEIIPDILEIYFPILASEKITEINEGLYSENYWQKIRFRLSLDLINPLDYRFKTELLY